MNELCLDKICIYEKKNELHLLSCHVSLMDLLLQNKHIKKNSTYIDNISLKYQLFKTSILDNVFMTEEHKHNIIYIFGKYNRLCNAFILLKSIWLRKKKQHVKYERTISFEIMKDIPQHYIVPIYEKSHIFHVYIKDITSVIKHALYHQHCLFIEPIEPRNPYTNTPLSHYNLYLICLKLNELNMMPTIIKQYFDCSFDLDKFKSLHYIQLQLQTIRGYIKQLSIEQKYNLLVTIFSKYDRKELTLFTNILKQVFVNDCSKLIYAEIVMLCFDEGFYDLTHYYRNIALNEVSRLKNKYKTYLHKRTNQTIYTYNTTLTDEYLETLV